MLPLVSLILLCVIYFYSSILFITWNIKQNVEAKRFSLSLFLSLCMAAVVGVVRRYCHPMMGNANENKRKTFAPHIFACELYQCRLKDENEPKIIYIFKLHVSNNSSSSEYDCIETWKISREFYSRRSLANIQRRTIFWWQFQVLSIFGFSFL